VYVCVCVGWVIDCEFWSRIYPASSFRSPCQLLRVRRGAHLVGIKGVTIVARVPAELLQINAPCSSRPFALLGGFFFALLPKQMMNTRTSTARSCFSTGPDRNLNFFFVLADAQECFDERVKRAFFNNFDICVRACVDCC
jgi:hypothetical protein